MAQLVRDPPEMQGTWVQSLGWEDPLEKEMATHSSILAWRILYIHGVTELDTTERLSSTHKHDPGPQVAPWMNFLQYLLYAHFA